MTKRIAVITGASKGIGEATASLFSDKGYGVINLSRTPCDVKGVENITWNLMDADWQVNSDQLISQLDGAESICLVHNSAVMSKEKVDNIEAQTLRDALELNVVAAARLNTLLIPKMTAGSSIVYISSTLGTKAVANTHSYVISKHAVIGQMRATCQDLAGSQIHTIAICPGFTETQMLNEHLGKNPELLDQITSGIAHGRLVQPAEIASTIWFASQTPAINGTIIHANLGQIES